MQMSSADKNQSKEENKKRSHSPDSPNNNEERNEANVFSSSSETADIVPKVHSANSWETVNLGDDQRKAKFLKLMGAAKKEHHGRFIIGDVAKTTHSRSTEEIKDIEKELKEQYEHSLTNHLKHKDKKHRGLGFDIDDQPTNSGQGKKAVHTKFTDEDNEKS